MPDGSKAIFLSYASQDAAAARRIADALRAFGVEVWFDQSELRGGDAWDQKIRKQIHECALFLPVISQHTQERREGYFRREWKLAVDRLNDMADGTPFMVPVCVDDTREREALVPEAFLAVQWTRLPRGETPIEFCQRVQNLLEGESTTGTVGSGTTAARPVTMRPSRTQTPWALVAAATVVVAVLSAALIWALRPRTGPAHLAETKPATPPVVSQTPPAAPVSEARQLVAKARVLHDQYGEDATLRDNLTMAEQLLKRATELDPADAEAWALFARVATSYTASFEQSATKQADALTYAKRAVQLAPESYEARLALADCLRKPTSTRPEGERMLRELIEQMPGEHRALRLLALTLISSSRYDEALPWLDRAASLPGGDAKALQTKANVFYRLERYAEAEAAVDQSLALKPSGATYMLKIDLTRRRGDLERAKAELAKVPPAMLLVERNAYSAISVWFWSREPDKMLALLDHCPSEYHVSEFYRGPKRFLTGWAYQLAGRRAAAETEWRMALKVVEQRLVAEPNSEPLLWSRIRLLAHVGEVDKATQLVRDYQKWRGRENVEDVWSLLPWLGRHDEAIDYLEERFRKGDAGPYLRNILRYYPGYDPLRGNPRFEALLVEPKPTQDQTKEGGDQKASAPAPKK